MEMFVNINKESCFDVDVSVKKGDLLIANSSGTEFDLTEGRIYVAVKNQGEETFYDCVFIKDDKDIEQAYSTEYFSFYKGELVSSE